MSADLHDLVPYPGQGHAWTHPRRLAAAARLWGLAPPPPETARVLELGCGDGWNVIAMAPALPDARFVGLDRSARQIATGRGNIEALGLDRVTLTAADLRADTADLGPFDYIIAHGVYSWVPREVQDRLFSICASHLAPNGLAVVSYNTLPGAVFRDTVRAMMRYQAGDVADPAGQVGAARAVLDFACADLADATHNPYARLLANERELVRRLPDGYLFHEHLTPDHESLWLHEFVQRAATSGLAYLGDAEWTVTQPARLGRSQRVALDRLARDRVHREQLLDFAAQRAFRHSLLGHPATAAAVDGRVQPERALALHVGSAARPRDPSDPGTEFVLRDLAVDANTPRLQAILTALAAAWPETVAVSALAKRLNEPPDAVARDVLRCANAGFAELSDGPWAAVAGSERPVASPVALRQAQSGRSALTNTRHRTVALLQGVRGILQLCDGRRDRAALLAAGVEAALAGRFQVKRGGDPLTERGAVGAQLDRVLDSVLEDLARSSFLVA